ncbi:MAG TPA: TonB-dependent receptor, partial [Candidatus Goldiibacteriota bacterium]|nr:TonB-dependent receptor [Candidatus Goldiibacteriota bacterium]
MKKMLILLMALLLPVFLAAAEETIEDPGEQTGQFKDGQYKAGTDEPGPAVTKGQGFDFKAPEILIKGKIDTKITVKREMRALENLQDVKNILYEKEKVGIPEYYLRDDLLSIHGLRETESNFAGMIKTYAGSMSTFFFDAMAGLNLETGSAVTARLFHFNRDNETVNDRKTWLNNNALDLSYSAKYGDVDAYYTAGGGFNARLNPFPDNLFGSGMNRGSAYISALFSGALSGYLFDAGLKYSHENISSVSSGGVYRENRGSVYIDAEKDFEMDRGRRVRAFAAFKSRLSNIFSAGENYNSAFNMDLAVKGVFNFDPLSVTLGIRLQDDSLVINTMRVSPYLNVNYPVLPFAELYFIFDPKMIPPDYSEAPDFTFISRDFRMPSENLSLKAGGTINLFEVYTDVFFGMKSVDDYGFYEESAQKGAFIPVNSDFDYTYAGINIQTLKAENLSINAGYTYSHIIKSSMNINGFANNVFSLKADYEKSGWEVSAEISGSTSSYGKKDGKVPAHCAVNLGLSKKLTDNFKVFGYVNNLLNNPYYVLYYYKEPGLNL